MTENAGMAELADALDSGSSGATRTGSSPATRTKQKRDRMVSFFVCKIMRT